MARDSGGRCFNAGGWRRKGNRPEPQNWVEPDPGARIGLFSSFGHSPSPLKLKAQNMHHVGMASLTEFNVTEVVAFMCVKEDYSSLNENLPRPMSGFNSDRRRCGSKPLQRLTQLAGKKSLRFISALVDSSETAHWGRPYSLSSDRGRVNASFFVFN